MFFEYENSAGCTNSYSALSSTDPESYHQHFSEVVVYDAVNLVARVDSAYTLSLITYTFYLKVTSHATTEITGPFTLAVFCGPLSAILTESEFE